MPLLLVGHDQEAGVNPGQQGFGHGRERNTQQHPGGAQEFSACESGKQNEHGRNPDGVSHQLGVDGAIDALIGSHNGQQDDHRVAQVTGGQKGHHPAQHAGASRTHHGDGIGQRSQQGQQQRVGIWMPAGQEHEQDEGQHAAGRAGYDGGADVAAENAVHLQGQAAGIVLVLARNQSERRIEETVPVEQKVERDQQPREKQEHFPYQVEHGRGQETENRAQHRAEAISTAGDGGLDAAAHRSGNTVDIALLKLEGLGLDACHHLGSIANHLLGLLDGQRDDQEPPCCQERKEKEIDGQDGLPTAQALDGPQFLASDLLYRGIQKIGDHEAKTEHGQGAGDVHGDVQSKTHQHEPQNASPPACAHHDEAASFRAS